MIANFFKFEFLDIQKREREVWEGIFSNLSFSDILKRKKGSKGGHIFRICRSKRVFLVATFFLG